MPSLKDIRARIKSAKNIQQITKAMKMVAAARLRKSQQAIQQTRPFAVRVNEMINEIARRQGGEGHALLEVREGAKTGKGPLSLIVVGADKGLCGGFNVQIIRRTVQILRACEGQREVHLTIVGRKPRDFFKRLDLVLAGEHVNIFKSLTYAHADVIGTDVINSYLAGDVDEVKIIFTEFVSAITLPVREHRLLPFSVAQAEKGDEGKGAGGLGEFSFEPNQAEVLEHLVPYAAKMVVWRALLESRAAEFAARITAMDSATRNSKDMINDLTLSANRIRQAVITREIAEIVGGVAALE
jgi:F-type H+-transporting ATPase subunit gamma